MRCAISVLRDEGRERERARYERGGGGVPGSRSRRLLELWTARDERRLASCLCSPSLSLSAHALRPLPSPIDAPRAAEHVAEHAASIFSTLFRPAPSFSATVIARRPALSLPSPQPTFLLLCFLLLSFTHTFSLLTRQWPPLRDSPSRPGRAPTLLGTILSLPSLDQAKHPSGHCLIRVTFPAYSRPAWTGPRASPTFSPAPANARLPNGNQQGPAGAFPPLANGARANASTPDPGHARILSQISGLTVRIICALRLRSPSRRLCSYDATDAGRRLIALLAI